MTLPAELRRDRARGMTVFVKMPRIDWAALKYGAKREFRFPAFGVRTKTKAPALVVGYCSAAYSDEWDTHLFVLESVHVEPLGVISDESIRREGFASLDEFRAYWRDREGEGERGYSPLMRVVVYRVHPFTEDDLEPQGRALLEKFYGRWLPCADRN